MYFVLRVIFNKFIKKILFNVKNTLNEVFFFSLKYLIFVSLQIIEEILLNVKKNDKCNLLIVRDSIDI